MSNMPVKTGLRFQITDKKAQGVYADSCWTLRRSRWNYDEWFLIDGAAKGGRALEAQDKATSTQEIIFRIQMGLWTPIVMTPVRDPWEVECPECGKGFVPEDDYLCEGCRARP